MPEQHELDLPESSAGDLDVKAEAEASGEAKSSSAPGDDEGLLAVVRDAVEKSAEDNETSSEAASPAQDEEVQNDNDELEPSDADKAPDDYSDTPFHKHPRFKQLIRERNELKGRAQQYDQIEQFMRDNDLQAEEVARALQTLANLKKGDPAAAYEHMQKVTEQLAIEAGKRLPDHLQRKVDDGYIDPDTAHELWRQQSQAQREAELARQENERFKQQQQRSQVDTMAQAVTAWEERVRTSDPDYDLKADMIDDRVRALVAERGRPRTSEEALEYAQEAYQTVSERLKSVRGPKQPMRTAVGGKVSGTPMPEPKNLFDVIQNTLAQRA